MATLNTLEGLADATTVTAGNSGGASGDAFDGVSGGANVSARTAAAMTGSRGLRCATASSVTAYVVLSKADAVNSIGRYWTDAQIKFTVSPNLNSRILVFEDGLGSFQGYIRTTTGNRLELRDWNDVTVATTASAGVINGATLSLVTSTQYRLGAAVLAYSTTVGQLEMSVWNAAGTLIDTWRSTATLDTIRGGGIAGIRWGVAQAAIRTIELDQLGTSTVYYPWLTPPAAAEGQAAFILDLATAASGSRPSQGAAALGLDLALAGSGERPSEGVAALGLDMALSTAGARASEGAAALGLDLALAASGSAPAGGSAAFGLDLALAGSGARPSQGVAALGLNLATAAAGARPSGGAAAFGLDLALATSGEREALGQAAFTLDLALATEGSDGQAGHPVPPFPYGPRPVDGYPWPPTAGTSWPWTPRPVRSFEEVTTP